MKSEEDREERLIIDSGKQKHVPYLLMKNFNPGVALSMGVGVLGWAKLKWDTGGTNNDKVLAVGELENLRVASNREWGLNSEQDVINWFMNDSSLGNIDLVLPLAKNKDVRTQFLSTKLGQILFLAKGNNMAGQLTKKGNNLVSQWRKLFPFLKLAEDYPDQNQYIFTKLNKSDKLLKHLQEIDKQLERDGQAKNIPSEQMKMWTKHCGLTLIGKISTKPNVRTIKVHDHFPWMIAEGEEEATTTVFDVEWFAYSTYRRGLCPGSTITVATKGNTSYDPELIMKHAKPLDRNSDIWKEIVEPGIYAQAHPTNTEGKKSK